MRQNGYRIGRVKPSKGLRNGVAAKARQERLCGNDGSQRQSGRGVGLQAASVR